MRTWYPMRMRTGPRNLLLGGVTAAAIVGAFFLEPIPQDPAYHDFADERELFGVPNFWNVATNLPFLVAGIVGLARHRRLASSLLRTHYVLLCVAVTLVAFGSAWYHLAPSNPTLIWDRLPMTVAFMALVSAVIADRISWALGRGLLWPLIALGIGSIAWWIRTEAAGHGDLRPYAIVQFLPMLLVPLILLLYRGAGITASRLWLAFGAYAVAKFAEHVDLHSLKHLLAALAAWWVIRSFQRSPASAL